MGAGDDRQGKPPGRWWKPSFWRRSGASLLLLLLAGYFVSAWFGGCAGPIVDLWPPEPAAGGHRIVVSVDSWHSVIGVYPQDDPEGEDASRLEEWSYAEKGYYLEGDAGCSGTLRALFLPSTGVVQLARLGRPWSERTPQPPARQWFFRLSREGYRNLVDFCRAARSSEEPLRAGRSTWYPARRDYHAFHHCHHWTARALRSAGLPVWSFYALFKWSLEAQLDRAAAMAKSLSSE